MYVIVDIKSKQYKVEEGSEITVDRLGVDENSELEFETVLFLHDGKKAHFGTPHVQSVKVIAKVLSHKKGDKVQVRTYRRRKDYHRHYGHRSAYTTLRITNIIQAA